MNCRMEHEPKHPPRSQKIHWQPDVSFRHFMRNPRIENIHGVGTLVNWRSQSSILPVFQDNASSVVTPVFRGNASSVVTPAAPAFIGTPLEKLKENFVTCLVKLKDLGLIELAMIGSLRTAVAPFERAKLLIQNENELINTVVSVTSSRSLVAAANLFLVHPLFYAGTRMATDVKTTSFFNTRHFYKAATAASYALNPWKQDCLLFLKDDETTISVVNLGFRVLSNLASYPFDTVSKRMMISGGDFKYGSSLNAFLHIIRNEVPSRRPEVSDRVDGAGHFGYAV
ncbi:hypothetical protein DITRI_Ditri19aG0039000 [Diplodiscus trichospermus]